MDEVWKQIAQHGPWAALAVLLVFYNQRNYEATVAGLNKNADAMLGIAKALTELSAAVHDLRNSRRGHGD